MAGLTPIQAMEVVRGLRGLNIIGGDLVEVSIQNHNIAYIRGTHNYRTKPL